MDLIFAGIALVLIIIFLLLGCTFVYCTTPNRFRWFDLAVCYAHRGLHDNETVPENSLTAFGNAVEKGLGVEMDLQYTADGEIVVFHDDDAKRLCGRDKKISEMTLEEVKSLRLLKTEEKIPTFEEALSACGEADIYCEIKSESEEFSEEFLIKICEAISAYGGRIAVASFNPYILKWFRENHPEIIRGQISARFGGKKSFTYFALSNLLTNFISKPDFVSYKYDDKSLGLWLCRFYGTRLVAWTVKSLDDVEKSAENGYSSFVGEGFDMTEV